MPAAVRCAPTRPQAGGCCPAAVSGVGHSVLEGTVLRKPKGGGGGSCQVRLLTGGLLADVIMHTETQRERALKLSLGQKLRA